MAVDSSKDVREVYAVYYIFFFIGENCYLKIKEMKIRKQSSTVLIFVCLISKIFV